ncbi:MAG: DUF1153 domain-containing protein [Alphaproteobacteria bacterium]|nr:DUF1153 domain-containing protein [Alphaproteobacteria bacterium]
MDADRRQPSELAGISAGTRDALANILPAPGTKRWVIRRKAAVVEAVRKGTLSLDDACRNYNLSKEEFNSWQRLIDRHGPRGLRATRLKEYREIPEPAKLLPKLR